MRTQALPGPVALRGTGPVPLPNGFRVAALLLLIAECPAHGYELLARLDELGLDRIDNGTSYRLLRGLEQDGLVLSWWEPSASGPARRTYRLTDAGRAELGGWAQVVRDGQRSLAEYLSRYDDVIAAEPAEGAA